MPTTPDWAGRLTAVVAAGLASAIASRGAPFRRERPDRRPWADSARPTAAVLQAQGRSLYFRNCVGCHGADQSGDEGPDLHHLTISDRRIATLIGRGIPGEMPAFARERNPAEIAALAAFVGSLR